MTDIGNVLNGMGLTSPAFVEKGGKPFPVAPSQFDSLVDMRTGQPFQGSERGPSLATYTSPNSVLDIGDDEDYDMCTSPDTAFLTPRPSLDGSRPFETKECPATPSRPRTIMRMDSLMETKLIAVTRIKRSNSIVTPGEFHFHAHFDFLRMIGRSSSSEVYLVKHKTDGSLYAVKRSTHGFKNRSDRERYCREIKSVANLPDHANIVGHYRGWQEDMHFFIQMELCEGGSLTSVIESMNEPMTESMLWRLASDVTHGLKFIHENNILHLDIKPDNIFLDGHGMYKVGDFGLAVFNKEWDWEEGDGAYVAPELLMDNVEPTSAADIFSLGATLFECATGEKLPRSDSALAAGMARLSQLRSEPLCALIRGMLEPDPSSRSATHAILAALEAEGVGWHPNHHHQQGSMESGGDAAAGGDGLGAGSLALTGGRSSGSFDDGDGGDGRLRRATDCSIGSAIALTRSNSMESDVATDEEGEDVPMVGGLGGRGGGGMFGGTPGGCFRGVGSETPVKPRRPLRSLLQDEVGMFGRGAGSPPLSPMKFSFA